MLKLTSSLILAVAFAAATVGCTSTETRGAAETAGANAGRVVDDSVITGKVKSALIADPTTKAYQIEVETYQGTVQLSGFVDSSEARTRAVEVTNSVGGVKGVKNALEVRSKS